MSAMKTVGFSRIEKHWTFLALSYAFYGTAQVTSSVVTSTASVPSSVFPAPAGTHIVAARRRNFWMGWARGGAPNSLIQSVPAATRRRKAIPSNGPEEHHSTKVIQQVVSVKTQQLAKKIKARLPPISPPPKDDTGFFYGLTTNMVGASTTDRPVSERKPKQPGMREAVVLTLDEIRVLREEMEALRKEVQSLKRQLTPSDIVGSPLQGELEPESLLSTEELEKLYQEMATSIEVWGARMLQEDTEDGWVEVKCNKVMRKTLNPEGTTRAYLKWMRDPRGAGCVNPKDDREYPCLKFSGVIDAPLETVCLYLSKERNLPEYNDLIESHKDLQEITPSSKVCLGQTPQILFIRPRSLVTFCQHRWLSDGSQLVLSQACRHPKRLNKQNMGVFLDSDELDDQKQPLAFALRGLNHIGPDPSDPENKTRITFLAHGNPGQDVPSWAVKTAVGALANIEPFKLFHRINLSVQKKLSKLQEELEELQSAQLVSERPDGRTTRPAGIAQLGYACFWPNGGGAVSSKKTPLSKVLELPPRPRPQPPISDEDNDEQLQDERAMGSVAAAEASTSSLKNTYSMSTST